jgi:hypothetical protein
MESDEDVYDSCDNTAECNDTLKLDLNDSNWVYSVKTTSTPLSVATIKAELKGNLNCTYTLTSSDFNADPEKSRNCPDGMI